jgi:hypothetical protein
MDSGAAAGIRRARRRERRDIALPQKLQHPGKQERHQPVLRGGLETERIAALFDLQGRSDPPWKRGRDVSHGRAPRVLRMSGRESASWLPLSGFGMPRPVGRAIEERVRHGVTMRRVSSRVGAAGINHRRASALHPGSHSGRSGTSKRPGKATTRRSLSDARARRVARASSLAPLTMPTRSMRSLYRVDGSWFGPYRWKVATTFRRRGPPAGTHGTRAVRHRASRCGQGAAPAPARPSCEGRPRRGGRGSRLMASRRHTP